MTARRGFVLAVFVWGFAGCSAAPVPQGAPRADDLKQGEPVVSTTASTAVAEAAEESEEPQEIEPDLLDRPPLPAEGSRGRSGRAALTAEPSIESSFPSADEAPLGEEVAAAEEFPEIEPDDSLLKVYVFSIGQANSTLFVGPPPGRRSMLVDLGEPIRGCQPNYKSVAASVEEILGHKHLNYFVITHYHTDHMGSVASCPTEDERAGGVFGLIDEAGFTIDKIVDRGDLAQSLTGGRSRSHLELLRRIDRWKTEGKVDERVMPEFGAAEIDLGSPARVEILAVSGYVHGADRGAMRTVLEQDPAIYRRSPASENDFSVAMEVSAGEFEYFIAGDLTGASGEPPYESFSERFFSNGGSTTYTNVESHLVSHWRGISRESDVEVYQANHHGSGHSSTVDLANALDPEIVIYSCGGDYDHPNRSIVERFEGRPQLVTSDVAEETWPGNTFDAFGEIAGEIEILVAEDGSYYSVNGVYHPAFADSEENN
ncbi:MAG TPA: hypothetical protein VNJ70_05970 [Thermoanaerobaculia bacterium]|nr:hypothetical protein [Thermoanaerobaculia bacterium]